MPDPEPAPRCSGPVAIVGGGVIGAGWVSRMVLSGIDVAVSDPARGCQRTVEEVVANAATAWDELGLPTEPRGTIRFAGSIADAVDGAEHVQENVPERLDLKQAVLAEIESAAPTATVIASSTSGLRPSTLQAGMARPERLVVAHPFNPVYLLPLVEVVGGSRTSADTVQRARAFYASLGMHPLHVRVEVDAFVADRLLEAMWREALWLVHDGVATTQEIDEAVTHGFGLRWAQMGIFETYRVAGGAGGFRHFIEQFGPALSEPWTKLTDTPALTPELVDTLVRQSDAQSGDRDVRQLERIRDRNLVGFLKVLEQNGWGAGQVLRTHRALAGSSRRGTDRDRADPRRPGAG